MYPHGTFPILIKKKQTIGITRIFIIENSHSTYANVPHNINIVILDLMEYQ